MSLTHSKKTLVHYHIMKSGGSSINHAFYCYAYNQRQFIKTALANNLESDIINDLNKDLGKAAFGQPIEMAFMQTMEIMSHQGIVFFMKKVNHHISMDITYH